MNGYIEVWDDHGNNPPLVLLSNGEVIDLSSLTRVIVNFGGDPVVTVDSSTSPTAFDWTEQVEYPANSGTLVDCLKLNFGSEGLTIGQYPDCQLILYDAVYTTGLVFTDRMKIEIKAVYA